MNFVSNRQIFKFKFVFSNEISKFLRLNLYFQMKPANKIRNLYNVTYQIVTHNFVDKNKSINFVT